MMKKGILKQTVWVLLKPWNSIGNRLCRKNPTFLTCNQVRISSCACYYNKKMFPVQFILLSIPVDRSFLVQKHSIAIRNHEV